MTGGQESDRLPACAYRYFWDIDPASLEVGEYSRYVIERLLEYGDLSSVRWMARRFSHEEIIEVLKTSRSLSRKRANFWLNVLGVSSGEMQCMSKPFRKKYRQVWSW